MSEVTDKTKQIEELRKENPEFYRDLEKDKDKKLEEFHCLFCFDGEFAPYVGRAPHGFADLILTGNFQTEKPEDWPKNFIPEMEDIEVHEIERFIPIMLGTWYCENQECEHSCKPEDYENNPNIKKLREYLKNKTEK